MKAHGQLVHVEVLERDGIHYRVAVCRVQGGLQGNWSCDCCKTMDIDRTHPTVEECISETTRYIGAHHREKHARITV